MADEPDESPMLARRQDACARVCPTLRGDEGGCGDVRLRERTLSGGSIMRHPPRRQPSVGSRLIGRSP